MSRVESLGAGNKFKKTEIGKIPVDWEVTTLENVTAEFISGGTPDTKIPGYWGGDTPWITGADFEDQKVKQVRKYVTEEGIKNSAANIVPKGSLLVVTRTGVGKVAVASFDIAISQDITGVIPIPGKVNPGFLYWHIVDSSARLKAIIQGTSINGLLRDDLASFIIVLSPLSEQKKIAEILSAVDEAVEKSREIIEKTRELKKGLMQQLLTRGIGHKKFKKTEIGEIPVGWEVARIGDCCDILDSQRIPLNDVTRRSMKGQYPYYGANGLLDRINDYIFDDDLILMAEDGGYFDEYKTRPIAYLISGKSWVNNHAHVLRAKKGWVREWMFYSVVHKNILPYIGGSTRSKLNQKELRNIVIPAPLLPEQKKIAEILTSVDEEIEKETAHKDSLEKLKKGLMQVLLTGKVRVK